MKNILIVLTALLGLFIFNCLIGWEDEIDIRRKETLLKKL